MWRYKVNALRSFVKFKKFFIPIKKFLTFLEFSNISRTSLSNKKFKKLLIRKNNKIIPAILDKEVQCIFFKNCLKVKKSIKSLNSYFLCAK